MKKTTILLLASVFAATMAHAETYYFDFGGTGTRGTATTEADVNGHYWNNITPDTESATSIAAKTSFALVDADNNASDYVLTLCNAWGVNKDTDQPLTTPDPELLGDLAVGTATFDFAFNTNNGDGGRSFVVRNLDPTKGYRFTIFCTRHDSNVREAIITLTGENSWSSLFRASGAGIGHNSENKNTDTAPTSDVLFPDASGNISLYVFKETTIYFPLCAMKMEVIEDAERPTVDGTVARKFYFDFGGDGLTGNTTCYPTENPDVNGKYWNNILNNNAKYCNAGTTFTNLVDGTGTTTDLALTINNRFSTNGGSGAGALANPSADLLGEMAVSSVTNDYFYTESSETKSAMALSGLDPDKTYRFYIFGSRSNAECRLGLHHFAGMTEWYGVQQIAGNNFSTTAGANTKNILASDIIIPNLDGTITYEVINNAKTYVCVAGMIVEEIEGATTPDIKVYKSATVAGVLADGENGEMKSTSRENFYD